MFGDVKVITKMDFRTLDGEMKYQKPMALSEVWCLPLGTSRMGQGLGLVLIKDQEATSLCGLEIYTRVGIFQLVRGPENNSMDAFAHWESTIATCGKSILYII